MIDFKKNLYIFSYFISLIISIIVIFYFTNHNNLKEHINLKSEHLKENINSLEKKVDEFKQDTNRNFDKIDKKLDELIKKDK